MMKPNQIHKVVQLLEKAILQWKEPAVGVVARKKDPFRVLISTIISLRTKDEVTMSASNKIFAKADTPQSILDLPLEEIEQLIYPANFYKNKAKSIQKSCKDIVDIYGGEVPDEIDELVKLHGVGRKTANLVVTLGFNKPGICVDIHVHRISNRMGYIKTKTPDESELVLREKLPKEYWIRFNDLLVPYGQNLCKPVSPFCSKCTLTEYCERNDVPRSR